MGVARLNPGIGLRRWKRRKKSGWKTLIEFANTAHMVGLTSCATTVRVCLDLHSAYTFNLTKQIITWVDHITLQDKMEGHATYLGSGSTRADEKGPKYATSPSITVVILLCKRSNRLACSLH